MDFSVLKQRQHLHEHIDAIVFVKMAFLIENMYMSLRISLTTLTVAGFWSREKVTSMRSYGYSFLSFMFMAGISIIVQLVDLFQIWGDVALMTGTSFLLLTNVALSLKIFNFVWKREKIRALIEDSDEELQAVDTRWGKKIVKNGARQSTMMFCVYTFFPYLTILGWATGPEEGELPTRAWYPYNTTTSPGYEISYTHQVVAVCLGAGVNVSVDTVVIALMAQFCCRLRLLSISLKMLGEGMIIHEQGMFNQEQEADIKESIRRCVKQHQSVLEEAGLLQDYFSSPIFAQFMVSMVIICVTAYQLAFESNNIIVLVGMATYFICMTMQVFLYCYQGHELSHEMWVGDAAYESPWYKMSVPLRKDLMMLMRRSQRLAKITAGGFTTLSLNAFMAIIKTSYTLFTVLQRDE